MGEQQGDDEVLTGVAGETTAAGRNDFACWNGTGIAGTGGGSGAASWNGGGGGGRGAGGWNGGGGMPGDLGSHTYNLYMYFWRPRIHCKKNLHQPKVM